MKIRKYDDNIIIRVKKEEKDVYDEAVKELYQMSVSEFLRDKLNEVAKIHKRRS